MSVISDTFSLFYKIIANEEWHFTKANNLMRNLATELGNADDLILSLDRHLTIVEKKKKILILTFELSKTKEAICW